MCGERAHMRGTSTSSLHALYQMSGKLEGTWWYRLCRCCYCCYYRVKGLGLVISCGLFHLKSSHDFLQGDTVHVSGYETSCSPLNFQVPEVQVKHIRFCTLGFAVRARLSWDLATQICAMSQLGVTWLFISILLVPGKG